MPQIFRIGSYVIYFWSNENNPIEPVHVHVLPCSSIKIIISLIQY